MMKIVSSRLVSCCAQAQAVRPIARPAWLYLVRCLSASCFQYSAEWQVQLEQAALREQMEQGSKDRTKKKDKKHKKSKHKKHSKKDKKEKHHKKHKHSKHKHQRSDSSTSSDSTSSSSTSSSHGEDDSSRRKRRKAAAHEASAPEKRILQRGSGADYEDSRGRYDPAADYSRGRVDAVADFRRGREPRHSRSRSPIVRAARSRSREGKRDRPIRSRSPERHHRNGGNSY